MLLFQKNWCTLFSCNSRFGIRPFCLLQMIFLLKQNKPTDCSLLKLCWRKQPLYATFCCICKKYEELWVTVILCINFEYGKIFQNFKKVWICTMCEDLFKVSNKGTRRTPIDFVLVSSLLILTGNYRKRKPPCIKYQNFP